MMKQVRYWKQKNWGLMWYRLPNSTFRKGGAKYSTF